MFGGKVSGYQLTIEAILDAAADGDGMPFFVCVLQLLWCNCLQLIYRHTFIVSQKGTDYGVCTSSTLNKTLSHMVNAVRH